MIYLGLDDFGEKVNNLDLLWRLHDYFDDFKVNLFTIPTRVSLEFFNYIKKLEWIRMCVHGYKHKHNEIVSVKRLRRLAKQGYSKVYRPPYFELPVVMEERLQKEGFVVANRYDWSIKDIPSDGFGFGHIYPHDYVSVNGNKGDSLFLYYKNIMLLPRYTKFNFYEDY